MGGQREPDEARQEGGAPPEVEHPDVETESSGAKGPGDLPTKLDPDFVPQDEEPPEEQRAREHPEETGS